MSIQPGQTQYLSYQNGFIRGICKSKDSVLVTWASGFSHPASSESWDQREFVRDAPKARLLTGEEEQRAVALFAR